MFNLKSLAILLISAQLALTAHVDKPAVSENPEVNFNVDDTNINIIAGGNQQQTRADCSASSANTGIGRLLREVKSILPLRKIQQLIVDSVANDQQVFALVALQRSETVRKSVANIKHSLEYRILREYACRQLNLDATEMWSFVQSFISVTKDQVKPSADEFKGSPGIRGLLQDIRSMLPRQQLKDLYQQLMEQDPQLSAAVQRIKSAEFRRLLQNVRLLPDSVELREQMLNVGVPLMELKELINVALGWAGDEFGDNGEDWKI